MCRCPLSLVLAALRTQLAPIHVNVKVKAESASANVTVVVSHEGVESHRVEKPDVVGTLLENLMPNAENPSDHAYLLAKFSLPPQCAPPCEVQEVSVLQWNLLAQGLADDDFLMKPGSPEAIATYMAYIRSIPDLDWTGLDGTMDKQKEHVLELNQIDDVSSSLYNDDAALIEAKQAAKKELADTIDAMKQIIKAAQASPESSKVLSEHGFSDTGCSIPGSLTEGSRNAKSRRAIFKKAFSGLETPPDVLTFQEFDDVAGITQVLNEVWPNMFALADKSGELADGSGALAPKKDSNALKYNKYMKNGETKARGQESDFGDDGLGILVNMCRYTIDNQKKMGKALRVIVHPRSVPDGHNCRDYGVDSVDSGRDGRISFDVATTHLTSGNPQKKENTRLKELDELKKLFETPRPLLFAADLNSDLYYSDLHGKKGSKSVFDTVKDLGERKQLASTWDVAKEDKRGVPLTATKLRGMNGKQPTKMGKLVGETIDYVFYSSEFTLLSQVEGPVRTATLDLAQRRELQLFGD